MNKFLKAAAFGAAVGILTALDASAQTTSTASGIITGAETAANSVMALCVTVGGFFAIYKIVKWIRK